MAQSTSALYVCLAIHAVAALHNTFIPDQKDHKVSLMRTSSPARTAKVFPTIGASVVRTSRGDCLVANPKWERPASASKPGVIFYDLGVEGAQSTMSMLGHNPEDSCFYDVAQVENDGPNLAPPYVGMSKLARIQRKRGICMNETLKYKNILEDVRTHALKFGFNTLKDQKVIMVEASPQYSSLMKAVQERYPDRVKSFVPYAVTAGYDDGNGVGVVYDKQLHTIMPGMVEAGNHSNDIKVDQINLMRLLTNTASKNDFVVLKMDVEGAEFDIIPCLAKSPAAALIDVLLLERHDHFKGARSEELDEALQSLIHQGVKVREDWP